MDGTAKATDREILPWIGNIEETTLENSTFRTALFTGEHAQLTVMCLRPGEEIGLEMHDHVDQFIRIERGRGRVELGDSPDEIQAEYPLGSDDAIVIPAGTWHNVINVGEEPLHLYSIYSPPEHPAGTVHNTKDDAIAAEAEHSSG